MKLNRRNVLVGLGTIVAGGGAALGTGAFSSVEATRDVTLGTEGDGSAYLGMEGDDAYVTKDDSSDTLSIDLGDTDGEGFNQDAITTVDEVVTLTNNAAVEETTLELGFDKTGSERQESTTVIVADADVVAEVTFSFDENVPTISGGESEGLNVKVDTTIDQTSEPDEPPEITLIAEEPTS